MRAILCILVLLATPVCAGQVRLIWYQPTANSDGSCIEGEGCSNDLFQYRVRRSSEYPVTLDHEIVGTVQHPGTEFTDTELPNGTFYWAVTAMDESLNESELSNQVSQTIENTAGAVPSVSSIVGLSATKKTAPPR